MFWTVIMQQNAPSFTWEGYSLLRLSLISQGVSERVLKLYSKCVYKLSNLQQLEGLYAFKCESFHNTCHKVIFGIPL
jgi:hypothetical protein